MRTWRPMCSFHDCSAVFELGIPMLRRVMRHSSNSEALAKISRGGLLKRRTLIRTVMDHAHMLLTAGDGEKI